MTYWKRGLVLALSVLCAITAGCSAAVDSEGDYLREYELGIEYLSKGEYQEAVLAFSAAIDIDPRSDAYLGRADAYFALERYEDAAADYEAAGDVLTAREYLRLADCYEALGDLARAAAVLEEGFALLGDDALQTRLEALSASTSLENEAADPLLERLNLCLEGADLESALELMRQGDFRDLLEGMEGDDLYFGPLNDEGQREGIGLAIYFHGGCYYGGWSGGQRSGQGIWLFIEEPADDGNYYCYEGSWAQNLPNGPGREERNMGDGWETTEGTYRDGLHHGTMHFVTGWDLHDGMVHHWSPITAVDGYWLVDESLDSSDSVAYSLDEDEHYLSDNNFHEVFYLIYD